MRLDGKRVIIIGGSSGIGLETARLALAEGASVLIAGRSEERLRKAAADLNSDKLRTAVADISDETSIQTMFAAEKQIDHVFLPAGELRPGGGDVLETDMRDLESLLKIRLLGVVNVVRQVRSKMKSGSITLMSGLYSTRPGKGGAMGAAGVAAIEGMTRALALDLAPLRVNAVAPGLIDTPLWNTFGPHRDAIMAMGASLPVGRIGKPEDVASGVLFLMQNEFRYRLRADDRRWRIVGLRSGQHVQRSAPHKDTRLNRRRVRRRLRTAATQTRPRPEAVRRGLRARGLADRRKISGTDGAAAWHDREWLLAEQDNFSRVRRGRIAA